MFTRILGAVEAGQLGFATELWRAGAAEDKTNWRALLALSEACQEDGQLELAREIAEDGFRITPTSSYLKAQIAALSHKCGDPIEALVQFREAIAIADQKQRSLPTQYQISLQAAVDDVALKIEQLARNEEWLPALDLIALIPSARPGLVIPPSILQIEKQAQSAAQHKTPLDIEALSKRIKIAECAECRSLDSAATLQNTARIIVDFAQKAGETFGTSTIWQLPSAEGTRFATAHPLNSSFIKSLRLHAAANGLNCVLRTTTVEPNLYEFDDEPYLPTEAHVLEFFPKPHCKAGQSYLSERTISLELVEARRNHILVPVAGKGPRFYSHEAIAKYAVEPRSLTIVPSWPFPIDLVYTWVDSSDPLWQADYVAHVDEIRANAMLTAAASASRWRSRDELRYSLRSVEMYAPFIRNIFIVTNGQKPRWLDDHPRVKVVSHRELYPDASVLPSFNSNSIETVLHRIPGIAEHFLYLNDDFFFSRACSPDDFFSIGGLSKLFFSKRYLDARPINPTGRATVACHKTTRDLLEKRFGIECSQKFQHAPHAMRKSVWDTIEREFPAELARTRANRVRAPSDLALALLYGYFALYTGFAQRARIAYGYVEIGTDEISSAFAKLEDKKISVFCLNDTDDEDGVSREDEIRIRKTLQARYPVAAAWEVDEAALNAGLEKEISLTDESSLLTEGKTLGPHQALHAYARILADAENAIVARKMFRLHLALKSFDAATQLARQAPWTEDEQAIAVATAEIRSGLDLGAILSRQPLLRDPPKGAVAEIGHIFARSARDANHLKSLDEWLGRAVARSVLAGHEAAYLSALAAANSGDFARASTAVEPALSSSGVGARKNRLRGVNGVVASAPMSALDELRRLFGADWSKVFLDGETLRSFARLGKLAASLTSINLATRDPEVIPNLRRLMQEEWVFSIRSDAANGRLLEADHVLGVKIALHYMEPKESGWLRRGAGVEWSIAPFEVAPVMIGAIPVYTPENADQYLADVYGPRWRSDQSEADSILNGKARFSDPLQGETVQKLARVEKRMSSLNDV